MTFGYDADWYKFWKPKNSLNISDFGTQLLDQLFRHYSKYPKDSKYNNVCDFNAFPKARYRLYSSRTAWEAWWSKRHGAHSLTSFNMHRPWIKLIFRRNLNTCWIIHTELYFLALRTGGADLAKTLQRIQRATFSGQMFVDDLTLGSKSVNNINKVFSQLYDKFTLVSFWESRETLAVGVLSLLFRDWHKNRRSLKNFLRFWDTKTNTFFHWLATIVPSLNIPPRKTITIEQCPNILHWWSEKQQRKGKGNWMNSVPLVSPPEISYLIFHTELNQLEPPLRNDILCG